MAIDTQPKRNVQLTHPCAEKKCWRFDNALSEEIQEWISIGLWNV